MGSWFLDWSHAGENNRFQYRWKWDMDTLAWIKLADRETESALTLLYTYKGFYAAIKDSQIAECANRNVEFWMVHNATVQTTLFMYMGRLVDHGSDTRSFPAFRKHCLSHVEDFSKEAFLKRSQEKLRINPDYLSDCFFPNLEAMRELFKLASPHFKLLDGEINTIRNKIFAHPILTEDYEQNMLFQSVDLIKIESALLTMWSVARNLWESYHNALKIVPEKLEFVRKEDIYRRVKWAVKGAVLPEPWATLI